jgi:hypothetical protein
VILKIQPSSRNKRRMIPQTAQSRDWEEKVLDRVLEVLKHIDFHSLGSRSTIMCSEADYIQSAVHRKENR